MIAAEIRPHIDSERFALMLMILVDQAGVQTGTFRKLSQRAVLNQVVRDRLLELDSSAHAAVAVEASSGLLPKRVSPAVVPPHRLPWGEGLLGLEMLFSVVTAAAAAALEQSQRHPPVHPLRSTRIYLTNDHRTSPFC